MGGTELYSDDWNCTLTTGHGLHRFSHLLHCRQEESFHMLLDKCFYFWNDRRVIYLWWDQWKTLVVVQEERCPWPSWCHTHCSHHQGPLDQSSLSASQSPSQLMTEDDKGCPNKLYKTLCCLSCRGESKLVLHDRRLDYFPGLIFLFIYFLDGLVARVAGREVNERLSSVQLLSRATKGATCPWQGSYPVPSPWHSGRASKWC